MGERLEATCPAPFFSDQTEDIQPSIAESGDAVENRKPHSFNEEQVVFSESPKEHNCSNQFACESEGDSVAQQPPRFNQLPQHNRNAQFLGYRKAVASQHRCEGRECHVAQSANLNQSQQNNLPNYGEGAAGVYRCKSSHASGTCR